MTEAHLISIHFKNVFSLMWSEVPKSFQFHLVQSGKMFSVSYGLALYNNLFHINLTMTRVCDAWAKMCPPTGFFGSETNDIAAPGSDVICFSGG